MISAKRHEAIINAIPVRLTRDGRRQRPLPRRDADGDDEGRAKGRASRRRGRPPRRKSFSRLWVRQISCHSARTLTTPRKANRRKGGGSL